MRDPGLLSSAAWSVSLYREKPDLLEKPDRNKFKKLGMFLTGLVGSTIFGILLWLK